MLIMKACTGPDLHIQVLQGVYLNIKRTFCMIFANNQWKEFQYFELFLHLLHIEFETYKVVYLSSFNHRYR